MVQMFRTCGLFGAAEAVRVRVLLSRRSHRTRRAGRSRPIGGARSTDRAQGGAVAVHDPAIASLFVTCSLHCEALPVVDVCFVFTLAWFSVMDACHPLTAVYTEHTVYARSVIIHLVTSCTHLYAKLPNLHL